MNHQVLIIDDDHKLNRLLSTYLSEFGIQAVTATHPAEGLQKLKKHSPDIVVLDVMLPEMNGFDVCRTIRGQSNVPIIMLTARGDVADRIVGLELGADDYLAKPFEPRELVARIQSVLRRSQPVKETPELCFGSLRIDMAKRTAFLGESPLGLTTNEFGALALLAQNAGKVLNRDQILQELRGMDCDAFNRSVDITMSRLRQKLGDDPQQPTYIKTVWGVGYLFIAGEPPHGA
jgi:DNA-binding response OmpR family regulator